MNLPRAATLSAGAVVLGIATAVVALLTLLALFVHLDEGAAILAVMMAILFMGACACITGRALMEWYREDRMIEDEGEL